MDLIRLTVVGDGFIGKTSMLLRYVNDQAPTGYEPTVFENISTNIKVDDKSYTVELWDTSGQEDYDRLRLLSYTHTDCFIVCFALNQSISYLNVKHKWVPDIKSVKKNAPIILVGTKLDLRKDESENTIPIEKCLIMKNVLHAKCYIECSAVTGEGINTVFKEAVRASLTKNLRRCVLL